MVHQNHDCIINNLFFCFLFTFLCSGQFLLFFYTERLIPVPLHSVAVGFCNCVYFFIQAATFFRGLPLNLVDSTTIASVTPGKLDFKATKPLYVEITTLPSLCSRAVHMFNASPCEN